MRYVPLVLALAFAAPVCSGDKKDVSKGPVFKIDYLEKRFGLKVGRITQDKTDKSPVWIVVLVCEKDLDAAERLACDHALLPAAVPIKDRKHAPIAVCFFDADGVQLCKTAVQQREGDVTGRKGDAVRLRILGTVFDDKAVRIELRESADPAKDPKIDPRKDK